MKPAEFIRKHCIRSVSAVALVLVVAGALLGPAGPAQAAASGAAAEAVGEFGFVIGRVQVIGADGQVRPVAPGDPVYPGDRIETGEGQHAHLRFVDQGFVSVRPHSRLVVEAYETDAERAEIRFSLEQGTVRAITGEAARARRDRFRLNTPMAAIGVRGTDFTVRAVGDLFRAVVNTGAIVVAPFGQDCTMAGIGPCDTRAAVELSDAMGRVLVELSAHQQSPRIVPLTPLQEGTGVPPVNEPPLERDLVSMLGGADAAKTEDKLLLDKDVVTQPEIPALAPVTPPGMPPVAPLPVEPAYPTQLAWGRWSLPARAGDDLSLSYSEARTGRSVTVASLYAGLFREQDAPELQLSTGNASFVLMGSHVDLIRHDGAISAGRVNQGALSIDFAQRAFSTSLSLSHIEAGQHRLEAAGKVRDDGMFSADHAQGRIAGAVSLDGREAGYLFDQQVPGGVLSGITLWAR